MKKNNKIIIFLVVLFVSLIVSLLILLNFLVFSKNEIDQPNNNINVIKQNENESINEVKVLNGLTFESTTIVYKDGISTLKTKVTNNDSNDYLNDEFKILIKDKENNVITELLGFIYGGVKANESRFVVSSVDIDLSSDAYYIEYEEVK